MEGVFFVEDRKWEFRESFYTVHLITSQWWCSDGDGVELYIRKDKSGFNLICFSGIGTSRILIDSIDFGVLWSKANKNVDEMKDHSYTEQCIIIADYLCSLFCEYDEV